MLIIPYSEDHKERLREIFRENTPTFYAPEEEGDFLAFLKRNNNEYFTIKSLNDIAGGGGYTFDGDKARLIWNMIDPKYRGQGLGKGLLNFCLEKLKQSRLTTIVDVWTSEHAQPFYEKFGFEVLEKRKDFRGLGSDLYHMQKRA